MVVVMAVAVFFLIVSVVMMLFFVPVPGMFCLILFLFGCLAFDLAYPSG